jgi:hypothetical protein
MFGKVLCALTLIPTVTLPLLLSDPNNRLLLFLCLCTLLVFIGIYTSSPLISFVDGLAIAANRVGKGLGVLIAPILILMLCCAALLFSLEGLLRRKRTIAQMRWATTIGWFAEQSPSR